MTPQDIVLIVKELTPCILLIGLLIIELINAIQGKQFFTVLLIREFTKMIIELLQEIRGKEWRGKLNVMACLLPFICILTALIILIRSAIFTDYTHLIIVSFAFATIFGFIFYWTFKASINFLSGFH